MGRGDQFMQRKFSVAVSSGDAKGDTPWPFESDPETGRKFCTGCDRPVSFCECPKEGA